MKRFYRPTKMICSVHGSFFRDKIVELDDRKPFVAKWVATGDLVPLKPTAKTEVLDDENDSDDSDEFEEMEIDADGNPIEPDADSLSSLSPPETDDALVPPPSKKRGRR
jgi:hypothetical protein